MPKTTDMPFTEAELASRQLLFKYATMLRSLTAHAETYRVRRDAAIRQAYDEGMTTYAIGRAVGLSHSQVQRICDLSRKDGA